MKAKSTRHFFASAIALAFAVNANAQWTVVNLHPAGAAGLGSAAFSVSGGQQVAGMTHVGGANRASLWSGTAASWVNLNPIGAVESFAAGVGGGRQSGTAHIGGHYRASLWSGTAASWVDLHPAGATESRANGLGGSQQVGIALVGSNHASLWSSTAVSWVDLNPAGAIESRANSVSGGQQVGSATFGSLDVRACLWRGTAASWVDLHPAGANTSSATGVSGGQQVGDATFPGTGRRASLWRGTAASWVNLHPPGSTQSFCLGTNGGQQVGAALVAGANRASLWSGTSASWVNLHVYLPPEFSNSFASGVWNDGINLFVAGYGYNTITSRNEALMWTRPDPDNFSLVLSPTAVAGQFSVLGTIAMVEAKPTDTVFTTFDNSPLVTTPPSVTVLAGRLSQGFKIIAMPTTTVVITTVSAQLGGITRPRTLILNPLIPVTVVCTPSEVTGGAATSCTVSLNGVAGLGGQVVSTSDNSVYATTPSTVTVPEARSFIAITISTTRPPFVSQLVTITSRIGTATATGTFRINP